MLTMHPSIMLGSYLWDEDRLPRDEFDIRLAPLRDAMASNGWVAALVYGDARELKHWPTSPISFPACDGRWHSYPRKASPCSLRR
jgi:hypothetical protein